MVFLIERPCIYRETGKKFGRVRKKQLRRVKLISLYPSPRLSAWNHSDATVHISLKFYTGEFTKFRRPIRVVWLKQDKHESTFVWRRTYSHVLGFYNSHIPFSIAALLVGRSPDRSPVVSLGIFSEASEKSMCPGSTQPFEMSTRIFLGVKTAGA
jgi:hypothetical protein